MICWRCGAEQANDYVRCAKCGAERPKPRKRPPAAGDAARRYQERMREAPDDAARQRAAGRKPARPAARAGEPGRGRGASRRPSDAAAPRPAPRSRSMPPDGGRLLVADGYGEGKARPVRRNTYEAILPETRGYDHVGWLRLCIIAVAIVAVLVAGIYFFLARTSAGQRWLASNGRVASADAYHEIGRIYMAEGSISRAVWALEIAQALEPDKLEVLLDLGRAYVGSNDIANAELAFSLAIEKWPAHPEPYRWMIDQLREQGENYKAMQLVDMAIENNSDEYFTTLKTQMTPATPAVSLIASRVFEEEQFVTLSSTEEDVTIYYTLDGSDPKVDGILYEDGTELHMFVGAKHQLRAVATKDGLYSKEQAQIYNINQPTPDMPKANPSQGWFSSVRTVSLRSGAGTTIYYTIDGTRPTVNSMPYDPERPVQLRIGKTHLRAIAVDVDGNTSNELSLEYECDGKTKVSMGPEDVVDSLKLFSTTRSAFESAYGAPQSESPDGENLLGAYTKLQYAFGSAVFLSQGGDREPVLVELSTTSNAFAGPRGTGVGVRLEDVLAVFRDEGGEANIKGNRILYTLTVGKIGLLDKLSETEFKISYYHKLDNGQFVELTFYTRDGLVVQMDWLQYATG